MNTLYRSLRTIVLLLLASHTLSAQTFDIGIFNNPVGSNILEIRLRPTTNTDITKEWSSSRFTIRWLDAYNLSLGGFADANQYNFGKAGAEFVVGIYRYQIFDRVELNRHINWTSGSENVIARIIRGNSINLPAGLGIFTIGADVATNTNNGSHYEEYAFFDRTGIVYQSSAINVPLPLELTHLQATAGTAAIDVDWNSVKETNFSHFELERATDGLHFSTLTQVQGGGSLGENKYNYADRTALPGQVYYYRLKMVDVDGSFSYSEQVRAQIRGKAITITSLAPNPTIGDVVVHYDTPEESTVQLQLVDMTGRVLQQRNLETAKGENTVLLELGQYAPGMYWLMMKKDAEVVNYKIVRAN